MILPTVLLVDDEQLLRFSLSRVLEVNGFEVTTAASVPEALKLISERSFDILLSDLHMPGPGDGLTVVSAMRHSNPKAVTMLLSAFPEMNAAAHAILLQADEILVKPMRVEDLVANIKLRLALGAPSPRVIETVAAILDRTVPEIVEEWLRRIMLEDFVTVIPLTPERRSSHLPQLLQDIVHRLRAHTALGTREHPSPAAVHHGIDRREQGYTASMIVEESRMLQVSIFHVLQKNLATIDFSVLLIGVMSIADEVDSQLSQAMVSFLKHVPAERRRAEAAVAG